METSVDNWARLKTEPLWNEIIVPLLQARIEEYTGKAVLGASDRDRIDNLNRAAVISEIINRPEVATKVLEQEAKEKIDATRRREAAGRTLRERWFGRK